VSCALIMGVMNGSLMVPFTLFMEEQQEGSPGGSEASVELSYLPTFSLGIVLVTPPIFCFFFLITRQWPVFHLKVALVPGLVTGTLWR